MHAQDDDVFENLVAYLESDEVRPVVSRSYPLAEVAQAQKDLLDKVHVGKLCSFHLPKARERDQGDRTLHADPTSNVLNQPMSGRSAY